MMSADHSYAQRRLAQALLAFKQAKKLRDLENYGPGAEDAGFKLRLAIIELAGAAHQSVITSDISEGTETSPLMGEGR